MEFSLPPISEIDISIVKLLQSFAMPNIILRNLAEKMALVGDGDVFDVGQELPRTIFEIGQKAGDLPFALF